MSSLDARARYTRNTIENCFMEILKRKPLTKITVTEICQAAQINRATFYKHYLDVTDLLEQIEKELLCRLRSVIGVVTDSEGISNEDLLCAIEQMLEFIRRENATYMTLSEETADPALLIKTFDMVNNLFFPVLQRRRSGLSKSGQEMLYNYLTLGCGGVLMTWIRNGMRESSHEVAVFLLKLSIGATLAV